MNKTMKKAKIPFNSYTKAYEDILLLKHPDMRPVRMQLETLKPEIYLRKLNINETIVCFGSARIKPAKEAISLMELEIG